MPTVRDAAKRLRRAYSSGWFSPDTREDIGTILDCIDRDIPPVPTQAYALEPGKHYVMVYDRRAVSDCMLKSLGEGLAIAGIRVFMVGTHGNPKDAIAFMPTNQTSQAMIEAPRDPMTLTEDDISAVKMWLAAEKQRHHPFFTYLERVREKAERLAGEPKKEGKTDG